MDYDIFISYSKKDSQIVNQFVNELANAGYSIWIDREGIIVGDQLKKKIVHAIRGCSILVFFSSANSNASDWPIKEVRYALRKGKIIIPIKLDDSEYADIIDFDLVDVDYIQHQENQFTSNVERLIASVAKHLANQKPSPSSDSTTGTKTPEELYSIGESYYKNEQFIEAVKWYRKAAEQGYAAAQYSLGFCYDFGKGVTRDEQEAVKWYRKAADQGHITAQYNLGVSYDSGQGVTQNYKEAVKWYRKAAEQGHAQAQRKLGYHLRKGLGGIQDDKEGVKWYQKAAEQGDADAQHNLGYCYLHGVGVKKDYQEAVKWYRKAVEQGNALAQCGLGFCYHKGFGVTQDMQEAIKWYTKAAEQGSDVAQYNLGFCYENGQGVKKNKQEAIKWYKKAAEQGNEDAVKRLKKLEG